MGTSKHSMAGPDGPTFPNDRVIPASMADLWRSCATIRVWLLPKRTGHALGWGMFAKVPVVGTGQSAEAYWYAGMHLTKRKI